MKGARREFLLASASAGLATLAGPGAGAEPAVTITERDVRIQTRDGWCDAALLHPASGRHPGVLVWTDAFGLRPVFREMGRRLAAQGYTVLVPNPFYRTTPAPAFGDISGFDFSRPEDRARLGPLMNPVTAAGAAEADAQAYAGFLLGQGATDPARKLGVHGYCMGGPLTMRSAAVLGERVGAAASFHGGGLVTDAPTSPHRLAPRIRARLLVAIAASDDERQPEAKDQLRSAFAEAGLSAQVEVYPGTRHGWCVSDIPHPGAPAIYSEADAERAFGQLVALYRSAL